MLRTLFKKAEEAGILGGEGIFFRRDDLVYYGNFGYLSVYPKKIPWKEGKLLDLASITKPLVTAYILLYLAKKGEIDLNEDIGKYIPELSLWKRTIMELATHSSGLPSWAPLYISGAGREKMVKELSRIKPEEKGKTIYSCPGYIALGLLIERVLGKRLGKIAEEFFRERKIEIRFGRIPKEESVPTELGNEYEKNKAGKVKVKMRDEIIWGEVHDGNSFFWGGDAGNAGAFLTSAEMTKFPALIEELEDYAELVRKPISGTRSFGWETKGDVIFHHGFTGGTLAINPLNGKGAFLYLSRTHPHVELSSMGKLRKEFLKTTLKFLRK